MAEQLIIDRQIADTNGDPISGAKLYAYTEGTTTLEVIYSDEALTTAHPSPLVADGGGNFPPIWHAGDHGVKIVIRDSSNVELNWSPLDPCPMTSSATDASNIQFTPTAGNPAANVQEAIENVSQIDGQVIERAANFTVVANDLGNVYRCTATLTLSFAAATTLGDGFAVKVIADGGDVTVDPDGSENINGSATDTLEDGSAAIIHCDGTGFYWIKVPAFADQATAEARTNDKMGMNPLRTGDAINAAHTENFLGLKVIGYAIVTDATASFATSVDDGFSSIVRASQGNYDFTFTTARSNTNYIVLAITEDNAVSRGPAIINKATTGFRAAQRIIASGATSDDKFSLIVLEAP